MWGLKKKKDMEIFNGKHYHVRNGGKNKTVSKPGMSWPRRGKNKDDRSALTEMPETKQPLQFGEKANKQDLLALQALSF